MLLIFVYSSLLMYGEKRYDDTLGRYQSPVLVTPGGDGA